MSRRLPMPAVSHFLRLFEQHHATFLAECDRLTKSDWLQWPMSAAYQGEWLLLPLISRRLCDGLAIDFEAHRRLCPETYRILAAMPEVVEAGFSRLEPGTHIYPHVDADHSAFVRCQSPSDAFNVMSCTAGGRDFSPATPCSMATFSSADALGLLRTQSIVSSTSPARLRA